MSKKSSNFADLFRVICVFIYHKTYYGFKTFDEVG